MTGLTKDELMQMARDAGFPFNKYGLLQGDEEGEIDADEMFERLANAILERAAAEIDKAEAISYSSLCHAKEVHDEDAAIEISCERAAYADSGKRIRALKINTGD